MSPLGLPVILAFLLVKDLRLILVQGHLSQDQVDNWRVKRGFLRRNELQSKSQSDVIRRLLKREQFEQDVNSRRILNDGGKQNNTFSVKLNADVDNSTVHLSSSPTSDGISKTDLSKKKNVNHTENLFRKVQHTLTRSHEAIWASISLTFLCVLLVVMVGYSKMWKSYHGNTMSSVLAFNDPENTSIPFNEVLKQKRRIISYFRKKWKSKRNTNNRSTSEIINVQGQQDAEEMICFLDQNILDDDSTTDEDFL